MTSIVIDVGGKRRTVRMRPGATVGDIRHTLTAMFPDLPPEKMPRVMSVAEAEREHTDAVDAERQALLAIVRLYPPDTVRRALVCVRRKGWSIDGMSIGKLREVATLLVVG